MASKDNDVNMNKDKQSNKRKINTVSPSKNQGASNAHDEEILSISSKESTMGDVLEDGNISSPPANGMERMLMMTDFPNSTYRLSRILPSTTVTAHYN